MVGIKLFEYINFYFRSSIHVVTRHHSCFSAGIQNAKQDLMNNANVVKECLCSKQYHTNTQINILSQKKTTSTEKDFYVYMERLFGITGTIFDHFL